MTLWIAMGALTALVLALLLRPLLRPLAADAAPPAALAIYRDQLAELEREAARGDVTAVEAESARRSIARRLLAAAETAPPAARAMYRDQLAELAREAAHGDVIAAEAESARRSIARRLLAAADPETSARSAPPRRAVAIVLLALLPASALALYLWLGQPELPGQPLSARSEELARANALKAELTAAAAAVKANAEDPAAWRRLGIALVLAGESQAAIDAIQTALTLGQPLGPTWESETWAMLAGAIMERRGETPPMARQALARALELDPDNLLALYLTGVVLRQDGRLADALDLWRYVEATGGDSLPFRALLEAAMREAEAALGGQPPPGDPG